MTAAHWFWVDASRERSRPCGAMFRDCVRLSQARFKRLP